MTRPATRSPKVRGRNPLRAGKTTFALRVAGELLADGTVERVTVDYLGIPGLLDAEQMRDLLRRRQEVQLTRRSRSGGDIELPTASGEVPRLSTHGQPRELRRELNALVSIAHHRTGKPHGWIHSELRRICGGPPVAAATTDQLQARIETVRTL